MLLPLLDAGSAAGGHRLQRRHRRRPAHHARPRRIGFFGIDSGGGAGCGRAVDLDRCGRHHERRSAPGARRARAGRVTYSEAAELAYNGAKVLHPRTLAPLVERKIPVWSKNSFAPEKPGTRIVPEIRRPRWDRAP